MNPQRSVFHTLLVPFLIGVLLFTGFLVYKLNPEIMNTVPLAQIFSKRQDTHDLIIKNQMFMNALSPESLNPLPRAPGHLPYRFKEIAEEEFKPQPLPGEPDSWIAIDHMIIAKNKQWVYVQNLSGELIWHFNLPEPNTFSPGRPILINQQLILATEQGQIYSFDVSHGSLLWYWSSSQKFLFQPEKLENNLIFYVEEADNQSWSIEEFDMSPMKVVRKFSDLELPLTSAPYKSDDDIVYYATHTGELGAFDLNAFKSVWSTEGASSYRGQPTLIGDRIYITNEDGLLFIVDRKNGKKLSEVELGTVVNEPFKVVEGSNIGLTIDSSGYLTAFDLKATKETKRLWRYNLNLNNGSHPPLHLFKLTAESFTKLNFVSPIRGWTVWSRCGSDHICVFDAKNGLILSRIDLKGRLVGDFVIFGEKAHLLTPVVRNGKAQFIMLENGLLKPPTTDTKPGKPGA